MSLPFMRFECANVWIDDPTNRAYVRWAYRGMRKDHGLNRITCRLICLGDVIGNPTFGVALERISL